MRREQRLSSGTHTPTSTRHASVKGYAARAGRTHEKEEDLAKHRLLEVVLLLVVLKLDVQAILDTYLHLNGIIRLRLLGQRCEVTRG